MSNWLKVCIWGLHCMYSMYVQSTHYTCVVLEIARRRPNQEAQTPVSLTTGTQTPASIGQD